MLYVYTSDQPERYVRLLQEALPDEAIAFWPQEVDPAAVTHVAAWAPPDNFFAQFHKLRTVFVMGAGVDKLLKRQDIAEDVTLIRLTPTLLRHRHSFNPSGFWEQWGGTLGRSDRAAGFRLVGFSTRLAHEMRRLSAVRPVNWAGNGEKPQQFPPFRQMLRVLAAVVL